MKIQTITYRRTRQLSNETEEFEAVAIVDQDTDPVSEAEELRAWVESRLGVRNSVVQLECDRNNLETECRRLESRITQAQEKWQKVKQFFNKLGISPNIDVDEIPF